MKYILNGGCYWYKPCKKSSLRNVKQSQSKKHKAKAKQRKEAAAARKIAARKNADSTRTNDLPKRSDLVNVAMDPAVTLDLMIDIENEFKSDREGAIGPTITNQSLELGASVLPCLPIF